MDNDEEVKRAILKSIRCFKRSSQGGCRIWNRNLTYQADTMLRTKGRSHNTFIFIRKDGMERFVVTQGCAIISTSNQSFIAYPDSWRIASEVSDTRPCL